jgi:hypothetical protein
MHISCDCGQFKAQLLAFPKNTPGRLMCYCDDCQRYLENLGRTDLLDDYGGTEVIPVYPTEIEFVQGADKLQCNRLTKRGNNRWSATCCNSPIANTPAGIPWVGIFHQAFTRSDESYPARLGSVRSRIHGLHARPGAPFEIAPKIGFKAMMTVMPFIIKGKILKKHSRSPFFKEDNRTPITEPRVLEA